MEFLRKGIRHLAKRVGSVLASARKQVEHVEPLVYSLNRLSEGRGVLICSTCCFLWCDYSHHGQMEASSVTLLSGSQEEKLTGEQV